MKAPAAESSRRSIHFAAVGDVHGSVHAMVRLLSGWEATSGCSLSFVLQVGDFEPIRHEKDLDTMSVPSKYRKIGDFPDYYSGRAVFPWPVYFIGGNHEPYGLLDALPDGGDVAENCIYLGRAGMMDVEGLRVVGLSGIFDPDEFERARPRVEDIHRRPNGDYTWFRKDDVNRAADYGKADVLVVHDWPERVIDPADSAEFYRQRRSPRYDLVGNEYARMLMEVLEPRLVVCGHLHKRYRNRVRLESGAVADVRCLANIDKGRDAAAIFAIQEQGDIVEVWPDRSRD